MQAEPGTPLHTPDRQLERPSKNRANAGLSTFEHLESERRDLAQELQRYSTRHDWQVLGNKLHALRKRLDRARIELVQIGPRGIWDALVEARPSGGRAARDLMVRTYEVWANARAFRLRWLCEPLADDEAAAFAIAGDYAFALLEREAGLHRLRDGQQSSVATVRVAAWTDIDDAPVLFTQLALKQVGQYGGKDGLSLRPLGRAVARRVRRAALPARGADHAARWPTDTCRVTPVWGPSGKARASLHGVPSALRLAATGSIRDLVRICRANPSHTSPDVHRVRCAQRTTGDDDADDVVVVCSDADGPDLGLW